jgi:hypothetical protein
LDIPSSLVMEEALALARSVAESLSFLDVTPVKQLMWPLEQQALLLQENSGLPLDQVNFLMLFFLSYPLALIHRSIWNTTVRHIFSAFFGILTVIYMMGNDFYHSLFSAVVVYLILCFVRSPVGTKMIWIWSFGMSAIYSACSPLP